MRLTCRPTVEVYHRVSSTRDNLGERLDFLVVDNVGTTHTMRRLETHKPDHRLNLTEGVDRPRSEFRSWAGNRILDESLISVRLARFWFLF